MIMFTEKQYEIADKILATVKQNAGRCNIDQFYNGLTDYDNHTMDYEYMKETLMKRYHAIEYMGKDEYWLILTNEGESIATIGLKKHLQKSADKEELEDKKLKLDVANGRYNRCRSR